MEIDIKGYKVLIDDEDYEKVSSKTWCVRVDGHNGDRIYFLNGIRDKVTHKQEHIRLHRFIMGCIAKDGKVVDHINRNTLDNRKSNLRLVTIGENILNRGKSYTNTTGYKGVVLKKGEYQAYIGQRPKHIYLGSYLDIIECAQAYDMMALFLYKEYACTNFARSQYDMDYVNKWATRILDRKNTLNTSGYTGVHWSNDHYKWKAEIIYKGVRYFLGYHEDILDAARAYDKKVYELHGSDADLNLPMESPC